MNTITADELAKKNIYDYGIDVISDRALPDFHDGLKPAQRRLIQTAQDLKATWNNKTVKSARITGDNMGRYHPHSSSYGSLVTLVNDLYPAVYGQGNWGDLRNEAAADRYTEAKLSEIGMKMIECNAVADTIPNYTGEFEEPVVIPSRFPSFFVNDCSGIAVGLSCSIPANNLEEIVNALKIVLKKGENTKIKDIAKYINGPDYRYGGKLLSSKEEVLSMYDKGEGSLKYECEYTFEKDKKNYLLTITGYCPGFSPDTFINKMTDLIDDGIVIYVNDASNKLELCKLEVMLKSETDFEKYVHKHLIKSVSYRYYAVERNKSENPEKDVDTKVLSGGLIYFMQKWLDYRRDIENKMCISEKNIVEEKLWKAYLRLLASKHINIIMEGLKSDNPIDYIANNLPQLKGTPRALEGAKYICDQKVISLQKIDQEKTNNDITSYKQRISDLEKDINNIDIVILRELDKLKQFYKPRCLKI